VSLLEDDDTEQVVLIEEGIHGVNK
jgi:hypothetical protein